MLHNQEDCLLQYHMAVVLSVNTCTSLPFDGWEDGFQCQLDRFQLQEVYMKLRPEAYDRHLSQMAAPAPAQKKCIGHHH